MRSRIPFAFVLTLAALAAAGCGAGSSPDASHAEESADMTYSGGSPGVALSRSGADAAPLPTSDGEAMPKPAALPPQAPQDVAGEAASAPPAGAQGPLRTDAATPMIIRTGNASVQVEELEPAVKAVQAMAVRVGGYVANSSIQVGNEEYRQAVLELKIPAERFDDVVNGLAPVGKVEVVNVTAEDVGEEFVDVTARVANARRMESRLVELLATRTGKLEDVLQVERELARVREEIERYEGRLRFLRTRVSVSTLAVTLHEPRPLVGESGSNPIARAFVRAWRNFVYFVAGLIEAMGWLLPLSAILFGIGWAIYRVIRAVLRSRRNAPPAPPAGPASPTS
jgi:hypothetical protein